MNDLPATERAYLPVGNDIIDNEGIRILERTKEEAEATARVQEFERLRESTRVDIHRELTKQLAVLLPLVASKQVHVDALTMSPDGGQISGSATINLSYSWDPQSILVPRQITEHVKRVIDLVSKWVPETRTVFDKVTETPTVHGSFRVSFEAAKGERLVFHHIEARTLSVEVFGKTFSLPVDVTFDVSPVSTLINGLWDWIQKAGEKARKGAKTGAATIAHAGEQAAKFVKDTINRALDFFVPDAIEDTVRNLITGLQKLTLALPSVPRMLNSLTDQLDFRTNFNVPGLNLHEIRDLLKGQTAEQLVKEKLKSLDPSILVNQFTNILAEAADKILSDFGAKVDFTKLPDLDITVGSASGISFRFWGQLTNWQAEVSYNSAPFRLTFKTNSSQTNEEFVAILDASPLTITARINLEDGSVRVTSVVDTDSLELNIEATVVGSNFELTKIRVGQLDGASLTLPPGGFVSGSINLDAIEATHTDSRWSVSLEVKDSVIIDFEKLVDAFDAAFADSLLERFGDFESDVDAILEDVFQDARTQFIESSETRGSGAAKGFQLTGETKEQQIASTAKQRFEEAVKNPFREVLNSLRGIEEKFGDGLLGVVPNIRFGGLKVLSDQEFNATITAKGTKHNDINRLRGIFYNASDGGELYLRESELAIEEGTLVHELLHSFTHSEFRAKFPSGVPSLELNFKEGLTEYFAGLVVGREHYYPAATQLVRDMLEELGGGPAAEATLIQAYFYGDATAIGQVTNALIEVSPE